jgi:hypothetical protein
MKQGVVTQLMKVVIPKSFHAGTCRTHHGIPYGYETLFEKTA